VLDRLDVVDRPAELLALRGVRLRLVEGRLRASPTACDAIPIRPPVSVRKAAESPSPPQ